MKYTAHVQTKKTPQSEPILGSNQVKNNAGGYAFPVTERVQLERFLTLGTEGGTFYVGERTLTRENAKTIIEMIQKNGQEVVLTTVEFSKANRAPKQEPALFVIALACTFGDQPTKALAYSAIATVARTSTHLFSFCQYIQDLRGWSRGLRRGVTNWYAGKNDPQLEWQLVKYRSRNGWTHRDVLRLAHPNPSTHGGTQRSALYKYATTGVASDDLHATIIPVFEIAQVTNDPKNMAKLISDYSLTWEMIPTEMLNKPEVLEALLYKMPMTAMMRNLNRFATAGLTAQRLSNATKHIVAKLTDFEELHLGRIHPITVLNCLKVYSQGHGFRGGQTWTPQPAVTDALISAFELSFQTIEPTGKDILVAVDISGSMTAQISNMALTCQEAAAALMLTMLKTEPNVEPISFDTGARPVSFGKTSTYKEVLQGLGWGGGTDCSQSFMYACRTRHKYDGIVVLTDSETWIGDQHPVQAYNTYRKGVNPNVKAVVVGMVANGVSLFSAEDTSALNVAGFDAAIPVLVNNFLAN